MNKAMQQNHNFFALFLGTVLVTAVYNVATYQPTKRDALIRQPLGTASDVLEAQPFWDNANKFFGEQCSMMQKESQTITAVPPIVCQEDVVLNLTISGAREQILCLLEQMDTIPGFSVVKGSFIVSNTRSTAM